MSDTGSLHGGPADERTPLLSSDTPIADEGEKQPKSKIGEIWCRSRHLKAVPAEDVEVNRDEVYELAPNQFKPLSLYHFRLGFKLGVLCLPRFYTFVFRLMPWTLATTIITSIISGVLPTFTSYLSAKLLDEVQKSLQFGVQDPFRIKMLAAVVIAVSLFRVGFNWITRRTERSLSRTLSFEVSKILNHASLRLDIPSLQEPYRRDILEAATIFIGNESALDRQGQRTYGADANSVLDNATEIITNVISLVSSFALLLNTIRERSSNARVMHIQILLVLIAMAPSVIGLLATFTTDRNKQRWNYPLHRRRWALDRLLQSEHRKEVILFNLRDWLMREWSDISLAIVNERPLMGNWRWLQQISNTAGSTTVNTTFQLFLALQTFGSAITLGSASLLQSVATTFIGAIEDLYKVAESAFQTIFFLAAFLEVTNLQPIIRAIPKEKKDENGVSQGSKEVAQFQPMESPYGSGMKLEFRHVSYKYPTAKQYALSDVNLLVEPGETLAIVGFNGAGKTTLLQCLLRLFTYEGQFLINDIDAKEYEPEELHKLMSACFQDMSKYPVRLRENIECGNMAKAGDAKALQDAVEQGGVDDFLPEMTEGLETFLNVFPEARRKASKKAKDEEAHPEQNLSGGQWQRVALARAFFKVPDSALCIFDEASANLDPAAEHNLFERIAVASKDPSTGKRVRTTIFVTHRFNTVRKADKIAVFEKGTISEFGTHEELMQRKGTYENFFNLQADAFK